MSKNAICYIVILIFLYTGACLAKYSGGTGEPNDPYLIATPNDLNAISLDSNDWDKHFKMIADINMAGTTGDQFNMIGNSITALSLALRPTFRVSPAVAATLVQLAC